MYYYKMVQVPPTIEVKAKQRKGNEAAVYLQAIANSEAEEGWEFHRVDTIGVHVRPGFFASLLGKKARMTDYYVITLRRPG